MSKSALKKFRKNDFYDDEENYNPRQTVNKRKEKRVERALRTKDISVLIEEEGLDPIEDQFYSDELNWDRK